MPKLKKKKFNLLNEELFLYTRVHTILNHVSTFFKYSDLHVCISYPKSRNIYPVINYCQPMMFCFYYYCLLLVLQAKLMLKDCPSHINTQHDVERKVTDNPWLIILRWSDQLPSLLFMRFTVSRFSASPLNTALRRWNSERYFSSNLFCCKRLLILLTLLYCWVGILVASFFLMC